MGTKRLKRTLAMLLAMVMAFGMNLTPVSAQTTVYTTPDLRTEMTPSEVTDVEIRDDDIVTVIVELKAPTAMDMPVLADSYGTRAKTLSTMNTAASLRNELVSEHEDLQGQITNIYPDAVFRYHYTNLLNGFAARVPYGDIEAIKALDGVLDVYVTMSYDLANEDEYEEETEFIPIEEYYNTYGGDGIDLTQATAPSPRSDSGSIDQMGLQTAWDAGYTGAGKVVAVFDSALRVSHELFSYMDPEITKQKPGNYQTKENILNTINANSATLNLFNEGWGSWFHGYDKTGFDKETQEKILNGEFYYNEKVPFSIDYMNGDLNVDGPGTSSHGTHVSGITAGNAGPNKTNGVLGAAYDSQIFFFKVFDERDDFGQEGDEAVFAALDDAVTLGVNSFNLSLGIPNGFTTMNTYAQAGYQKAYNRAKAAGISVAISSGNDARDTHAGANYTRPSILPNGGTNGFSGSLFSPLTVASAQGTGSSNGYYYLTDLSFNNAENAGVYDKITLRDNNITALGTALNGSYELVNIGSGTITEILAASGAATLTGALAGKVAMIELTDELYSAQVYASQAGAVACIVVNKADKIVILSSSQIWNLTKLPVIGMFPSSQGKQLAEILSQAKTYIKFTSTRYGSSATRTYPDSGPASYTSWGVTESLKLKPEIMAPGSNIYSSTNTSDTAYVLMSGTSMASPNMEGALILIQQALDAKIAAGIFNVTPGTHEYSELVDQLAGSTAKVYSPLASVAGNVPGVYFSPRRQGAGMVQVNKAIATNVILNNSNTIKYNPVTGEAPRAKVELGDKLEDTFTFSFMLENHNNTSRIFKVSSVLQTDALSLNSTTGRYQLYATDSTGKEVDPIGDAVIKVKSISSGAILSSSDNINRYAANYSAAAGRTEIIVPSNSSVEITIEVDNTGVDFVTYDKKFPNGMFLDGYVWFESDANENVNIPFMGFRGDWTKAPIFDLADAYTDVSNKSLTDNDYPMYHVTAMHTTSAVTGEVALGANQYTNSTWPGYQRENTVTSVRTYFKTLRDNGNLNKDYIAISPDGDGYFDLAYANLALLRNAKALCVVIRNSEGETVNILGPEYEYFENKAGDGNLTQQIAATYGTKYLRNMGWNGTDSNGNLVADGQYTYEVKAIVESEYLEKLDYNSSKDKVLNVLLNSDSVQSISFPVKVDTVAPSIITSKISAENTIDVTVADSTGIQSIAAYYDGTRVGNIVLVNSKESNYTFDLSAVGTIDPNKVQIQAVDYAMNLVKADVDNESKITVVGVQPLDPVSTYTGIAFELIPLPEEVDVSLSDGSIITSQVNWLEGSYDKSTAGSYSINGILILPDGITNPGSYQASIIIISKEAPTVIPVESIKLSGLASMKVGTSQTLVTTITPFEAADAKLTWSSSSPSILDVSQDGVVKAVKTGSARVTATAENGVTYTILIRVTV